MYYTMHLYTPQENFWDNLETMHVLRKYARDNQEKLDSLKVN